MQNLKRLGPEPDDVEDDLSTWTNEDLARNLRQVFMAEHPEGKLLVGDFSSVESRGLAYLAGAEWKLDAYRNNQDMYKVLASSMFHTSYESVTKEQRQAGKVGELSCGYGAGAGAVSKFAAKMHIEMSEAEARELVTGWRSSNPEIVELWSLLDEMLHEVVEHGRDYMVRPLAHGLEIVMATIDTPASLLAQRRDAKTVTLRLYQTFRHNKELVLYRVFQGCFMDGRDICYHKPSELKGGKLWLDRWTKDRQSGRYKLYGGKLAGILTQSFCREIFFDALVLVNDQCEAYPNLEVIGQFHDEIVVEWSPDPRGLSIEEAKWVMEDWMSRTKFTDFPLKAVVKYDHRYTK